jgi:hypothetical protein
MSKREWVGNSTMTENFLCSILIATGCFHDSEFGQALQGMFNTGEELEIVIRPKVKKVRVSVAETTKSSAFSNQDKPKCSCTCYQAYADCPHVASRLES